YIVLNSQIVQRHRALFGLNHRIRADVDAEIPSRFFRSGSATGSAPSAAATATTAGSLKTADRIEFLRQRGGSRLCSMDRQFLLLEVDFGDIARHYNQIF